MPVFTSIGIALGATAATAFTTGAVAAGVAAAGIGYSQYAKSQGKKDVKKATAQADQQAQAANAKAIADLEEGKAKAASQAKASLLQKQQAFARNKSVYTSPLGLNTEATVAKKTLLGQ